MLYYVILDKNVNCKYNSGASQNLEEKIKIIFLLMIACIENAFTAQLCNCYFREIYMYLTSYWRKNYLFCLFFFFLWWWLCRQSSKSITTELSSKCLISASSAVLRGFLSVCICLHLSLHVCIPVILPKVNPPI